jgi:hypothetical protein
MKRVAPLVAVAAAALVAGCGSSSLSASQLRSQAGQVCALAGHQAEQIKDPAALGGGVVFLRDGIAVLTPELRQLQKLTPSQASERSYATALGAFSGELHDLTTTVRGLDKGDDPVDSIQSLEHHLAPLQTREDVAWRALGIPACITQ